MEFKEPNKNPSLNFGNNDVIPGSASKQLTGTPNTAPTQNIPVSKICNIRDIPMAMVHYETSRQQYASGPASNTIKKCISESKDCVEKPMLQPITSGNPSQEHPQQFGPNAALTRSKHVAETSNRISSSVPPDMKQKYPVFKTKPETFNRIPISAVKEPVRGEWLKPILHEWVQPIYFRHHSNPGKMRGNLSELTRESTSNNGDHQQAIPCLAQEVAIPLCTPRVTINNNTLDPEIPSINMTTLKEHIPSVSRVTIYETSNLRFTNRLSDIERPTALTPVERKIRGTMDLFFAEMFWYSVKKHYPQHPHWEMIDSLQKDYISLWLGEMSEQLNIRSDKFKGYLSFHMFTLNEKLENDATKNPSLIKEIFIKQVYEVAEKVLCEKAKNETLLMFCAFVREMFVTCINNINFPINSVILSIVDIVLHLMNWKTFEEVISFSKHAKSK